MSDPISRLEVVQREVDRVFGAGYAAAHPEVLVVVVQSAASDWAAARLAAAIDHVAIALAEPEETETQHAHPAGTRAATTTPVTGILGFTRSGRRLRSRNGIYGISAGIAGSVTRP